MELKQVIYDTQAPLGDYHILGADIGGTNSNFGFFSATRDGELNLLFSLHAKSQYVTDFTALVKQVVDWAKEHHGITVKQATFAAAGVISSDKRHVRPTNARHLAIDAHELERSTGLTCVSLVNDFEVIGYGLSYLPAESIVQVKQGVAWSKAHKAIIGAGTGLGKSIMLWDEYKARYEMSASEGGHADFAAHDPQECELTTFIQAQEQRRCAISWEDVLSGNGIKRLYHFFQCHNQKAPSNPTLASDGPHPDEIFQRRHDDDHAWETYKLYAKIYARCAKNFALDALSLGGIYIAGGIAAKNIHLFKEESFIKEFINCGKQEQLLHDMPIYVIADYNVSLYGAASYMIVEKECQTADL